MAHKYNLHYCRDCESEFVSCIQKQKTTRTAYCPLCGENIFVDRIRLIYSNRFIPKFKTYTAEEDAVIIEGRKRGMSLKRIADELDGRDAASVKGRISQLRQHGLMPESKRKLNSRVGV